MKVRVNIYENQISLIKPGMSANVSRLALPDQSFRGEVTVVTPLSVVLSLFLFLLIGMVFGIYPARRAAGLNPIDALRH